MLWRITCHGSDIREKRHCGGRNYPSSVTVQTEQDCRASLAMTVLEIDKKRHCEEPSNPSSVTGQAEQDCRASLAMTVLEIDKKRHCEERSNPSSVTVQAEQDCRAIARNDDAGNRKKNIIASKNEIIQ